MTGQSAFPDAQNLPGMRRVIIPLVEEDMTETRTDHRGDDHIYEQASPYSQRTEREEDRIGIPDDCPEQITYYGTQHLSPTISAVS